MIFEPLTNRSLCAGVAEEKSRRKRASGLPVPVRLLCGSGRVDRGVSGPLMTFVNVLNVSAELADGEFFLAFNPSDQSLTFCR